MEGRSGPLSHLARRRQFIVRQLVRRYTKSCVRLIPHAPRVLGESYVITFRHWSHALFLPFFNQVFWVRKECLAHLVHALLQETKMLIYTGAAMLLWAERDLVPNRREFWGQTAGGQLSMHPDVKAAVHEALRAKSNGSLPNHRPWIMVDGIVLDCEEIEMIYNHSRDPLDAVVRY